MGDGDEAGGMSEGGGFPSPSQLDADIQSAQAAVAEMEEEALHPGEHSHLSHHFPACTSCMLLLSTSSGIQTTHGVLNSTLLGIPIYCPA